MRTTLSSVVCLCWLLNLPAGADTDALRQPWSKAVEVPALTGEAIVGLRLDGDVYAGSSDTLSDLRLVAGEGRAVPYALEREVETALRPVRVAVAVVIDSVREAGSNALEVVWSPRRDAGRPPPGVAGFRIETPLRDFERRLSVHGLENGAWRELVSEALLFDYSRFMDARQVEVSLPSNAAAQFRLRIDTITDRAQSPFMEITRAVGAGGERGGQQETFSLESRPMRIDRIEAWRIDEQERVEKAVVADYGSFAVEVVQDTKQKRTLVEFACRREPLVEIAVETASRNFRRQAELQVPVEQGVRTDWRTVARTTLSAIAFGSYSSRDLVFAFEAARHARYRIVIQNGDSPPLAIIGVRGRGAVYRLLFLHDGLAPLHLVYGGADIPKPVYDTAGVLGAIRGGSRIVEARLGPAQAVAGAARGLSLRRLINSRVAFGLAVAAAVAALAAVLYRAIRQTEAAGDGD